MEDVARYVLRSSDNAGRPSSNLRLQKLLYFVDGYYMALNGGVDLFGEDFLAWTYGPVVRKAYTLFMDQGADKIREQCYAWKESARFDEPTRRVVFESSRWDPSMIGEDDRQFIDKVVRTLGRFSDSALVDISHDPAGPWRRHYDGRSTSVIPKTEIREYFEGLFAR